MKARLASARSAQRRWARVPLRQRLALVRRWRIQIAENASLLAELTAQPHQRPVTEKLVSEVIPLLDACRFLEREGRWILRARRMGRRGRPLWLSGSSFTVERKPFGVILIVGPRNYPLFLPGVQMLQALVAGNAILLKPAEGCTAPLRWLVDQLIDLGLEEEHLIQLLPEAPAAAQEAVREGLDKVIFTGSSENGRHLLGLMAEQNTPGVFELSGADVVIVRQDADLDRAAGAVAFGRTLNDGQTCMAPALVLAQREVIAGLRKRLGELSVAGLDIQSFGDDQDVVNLMRTREYGLGAAIFSADAMMADQLAHQLPTGFVTINDVIVPTADPRFPFGGVRASGFGTTRGAEGLLEMTYPHVVAVRRSRWLPHLQQAQPGDEDIFLAYARLVHGRGARRIQSLGDLWRAMRQRGRVVGLPRLDGVETPKVEVQRPESAQASKTVSIASS
ncbi:MAG: aldehyde dehydrogenase family protein [Chthoniobacterales bacterium]